MTRLTRTYALTSATAVATALIVSAGAVAHAEPVPLEHGVLAPGHTFIQPHAITGEPKKIGVGLQFLCKDGKVEMNSFAGNLNSSTGLVGLSSDIKEIPVSHAYDLHWHNHNTGRGGTVSGDNYHYHIEHIGVPVDPGHLTVTATFRSGIGTTKLSSLPLLTRKNTVTWDVITPAC